MYTLLLAIFPSLANLPNGLPASAGIDTANFLCFFLFCLLQLIPLWFPIHSLRHLFTAKAIFAPAAGLVSFLSSFWNFQVESSLTNFFQFFFSFSPGFIWMVFKTIRRNWTTSFSRIECTRIIRLGFHG